MIDQKLITFIQLAHYQSFTLTARALNMTQPAVSQHIQWLENHYGAKLVHRSHKKMALTEPGQILLKHALRMQKLNEQTFSRMQNLVKTDKKYSIGCSRTIGELVLPPILVDYKRVYPHTDIHMLVENTETILEKLREGDIALGLVEGPFDKKRFPNQPFMQDELVLVGSKDAPLGPEPISLETFSGLDLILRESGSGTRDFLEEILLARGLHLSNFKITLEIGSINAIKYFVRAGLGYTILSSTALQEESDRSDFKVIPIEGFDMSRTFHFVCPPEAEDDGFSNHFMNFCMEHKHVQS